MDRFPFPDKAGALQELMQDHMFQKVTKEQISLIVDDAWEAGIKAAEAICVKYPGKSASEIFKDKRIHIIEVDEDRIIGNMRYFSDYYSGRKEVCLYQKSIRMWADAQELSYRKAKEIILFHELFHHLECHEPELIQIKETIPWMRIGKWMIGKRKLQSQSEIGAYGFSRTCYQYKNDEEKR